MSAQYQGRYFDGETATRREVRVTLTAQGVEIAHADGAAFVWPYGKLRRPERLPGGGVRIACELAPMAQLAIEAPEAYAPLRQMLPRFQGSLGRWREHRLEIVLVVALVLFIVGGGFVGIPMLAKPIAQGIPDPWAEQLGRIVEQQIVAGARDCSDPAGRRALDRLLTRLLAVLDPLEVENGIEVRVVDRKMVNAFAAPGGRIVIMGGLLAEAGSADEVAGVLAHEIGHAVERHPTANAIRVVGLMTLLDLVMGDSSEVLEVLGQAGGVLLLPAYSREDERAADQWALAILAETGIDTGGLASFFGRLHKKHGERPEILSYVASHPDLEERRQQAQAVSGRGSSPALGETEWQALKQICDLEE